MAKTQQISLSFNLEDTKGYKEIMSRLDALEAILQDLKDAKAQPQEHIEQWLNVNQVMEYIGISATTIYQWMRDGTFPKGELLGPKSRRWRVSEINKWRQHIEKNNQPASAAVQAQTSLA